MKICPNCQTSFRTAKRINNIPTCRSCGIQLFYSQKRGAILLKDKLCVDHIITMVSGKNESFGGNGTHAERKFAYDLLDRTKSFLKLRANIGLDCWDFLKGLISYILIQPWWCDHLESLIMLKNKIGEFAQKFYNLQKEEAKFIKAQSSAKQTYQDSGFSVFQLT